MILKYQFKKMRWIIIGIFIIIIIIIIIIILLLASF